MYNNALRDVRCLSSADETAAIADYTNIAGGAAATPAALDRLMLQDGPAGEGGGFGSRLRGKKAFAARW